MSDNFPADKDWEEAGFRARVLAELPAQLTQGSVEPVHCYGIPGVPNP
jgi:putative transposase